MKKNLRTLLCVLICLIAMSVFGMYAFAATDGYYTYEIENNKAVITDVDTSISGDVTIPSTINGYLVVTVTDNAFVSCKNITSVTIPKNVTALGPFVFSDCSSLTRITVESGNVVYKAVDGILYSLDGRIVCYPAGKPASSFTIPSGVTSISNNAFSYCSSLTSITIPKSVTSIHSNAFSGCSLTGVTVESDNTTYKSENDVLYTKDGKTLVYYPAGKSDASFIIPDGVTSIGDSAFESCKKLTGVTILNGVASIGYKAFSACDSLTSIIIPNSVTTIGKYAFEGCRSLTIYAEAASKPAEWSAYWNPSNRPIKWDYDTTLVYYTYTVTDGKATITDVDTAISGDITVPSKLDGYPVVAIGDSAFASCKNLTGVTIPNGVTSIGYQAFAYCDNLTSISIPDSVTSIGSYVFSLCSSLSDITIPNGVTSISERAFQSCNNLTSIIIPDSVTSIGRGAFANCSSLTSISIPNSVTSIGGWAFASCSSLESITIPNSVTSIGDYAFRNCTSLTSITIPNSVTSIDNGAFEYCSSLTSITVPDSVTTIGDDAFYGCSSLTDITVEDGNTVYKSEDGVLYTIDGKTIVCYPGGKTAASFAIPYGVTSIGNYAFASCDNLTSITIPNSVTSIGEGAFCDCSSLTSIKIPNGVTSIGEEAFKYCSSLTSITIPDSITSIDNGVFASCDNLTSITIPNSVTSIGEGAFASCSSLTSITIPNSVITIGDDAFGCCSNLTKIIIPRSVTSIGQTAFLLCDSLINIYIPDSVTSIGPYAFGACNNPIVICVEAESKPEGWADDWNGYNGYVSWGQDASLAYYTWEITDGKATITDVDHAIYGDITIPATIFGKPVVAIGDYAFADCDNIAAVIIPDSITNIGFGAFSCCGLTSVTIPAGVTSIGFYTFDLCTRLASIIVDDDNTVYKSVDGVLYSKDGKELICYPMGKGDTSFAIPEGVTTLGPHAFYVSRLTEVAIPDSVTTIGTYAFSNCYGLTKIIIPVSVTTIRDYAFQSCSTLTIYAGAESQPAGWNSNWNPTNCPVVWGYNAGGDTEPDSTTNYYTYEVIDGNATITAVDPSISGDITIPAVIDGYPVVAIGIYAFADCDNLVSVTIPEGVVAIEDQAFYYCENLKRVAIPASVNSIGAVAVNDCYNFVSYDVAGDNSLYKSVDGVLYSKDGKTLVKYPIGKAGESFVIPTEVQVIGEYAFFHCGNLKTLDISHGVTTIENNGVYNCNDLITITISSGVTYIGDKVFDYCQNLEAIVVEDSNTAYKAVDGVLYTEDGTVLVHYPANKEGTRFDIPMGVTTIDDCAFAWCDSLFDITIPAGVTTIGSNVFDDIDFITNMVIPASVTTIGSEAFIHCSRLDTIYAEASSKPIGWDDEWNTDGIPVVWGYTAEDPTVNYYTYTVTDGKATITDVAAELSGEVTVPSTLGGYPVVAIGRNAFRDCADLVSVIIPSGIETIGSHAFFCCNSLESVIVGKDVAVIGENAFANCSMLTSITVSNDNAAYKSVEGVLFSKDGKTLAQYPSGKAGTSYDIPVGVTDIADAAFWNAQNLTSVTIPEGVTCIGERAFFECSRMTEITIPASVTDIREEAFTATFKTYYVESGNQSYKAIDGVLYTLDGSTIVQYPAGKESTSFVIPESVTTIGYSAFRYSRNLTDVTIPDGVAAIMDYAFYNCSNISSLIIPVNVTTMGRNVFQNCKNLTIYAEAASQPEGWNTNWNNSNCPVVWGYVADDDTDDGVEDGTYTDGYYTYIVTDGKATITAVDAAISGDITIPATLGGYPVVAIGEVAFQSCTNLIGITIPASVTSIGNWAFNRCSKLAAITVAEENTVYKSVDGVLHTKDGTKLIKYPEGKADTSYAILPGVTTIQQVAFWNCDSLANISIPASVMLIVANPFECCYNLEFITVADGNITYKSVDGVLYTKDGTEIVVYPAGKTDTSYAITYGVNTIGHSAFLGCSNLTSITIPDSAISIGANAFLGCSNLTSIAIPSSVTTMGVFVFGNTTIFAEAASQPAGWNANWNSSNRPVVWGYVAPAGISLSKTSATITEFGGTVQLTATLSPDNATNVVTWASSNTSIATVDASGKVTAKSNGTAVITATTVNGLSAQCTVTVTLPVEVASVTLNNRKVQMDNVGDTFTISATVYPADAEDKTVTWKSSNTSVATVDANGKVTAVSDGIAVITVTSVNGISSSCRVYVGERNATTEGYGNFRTYFTSCPLTLNPLATQDTNPWTILEATGITLYRTVINSTKDGYIWDVNLAASMPTMVDTEGYVWQYTISPDAVWEDGTPITVDDIEFMLKQFADPLQQNLSASSITTSSYGVIKNIYEYQKGEVKDWSDVAYAKIDDYTFQVEFTRSITQYDAIRALNQPLVYAPLYNAGLTADCTATTYGTSLATYMSAGPFILTEWIPDAKFVLTKNPDYIHADEISLENITYIIVPDTSTALQLFEKGELDYASISYSMWQTYENDPRLYEYFNDSLMYMFVNWGNPRGNNLLGNLKFRQALHYGMDRVEIANTLHVYPATRLVRKAVMTSPASGKLFVDIPQNYVEDGYTVRNTTKALQLLTQAFEENDVESFELRILTGDTANAATSHIRAASDILMRQYNDLFKGKMTTVYQVVPANQTTSLRRYNPNNPGAFDTAIGSLLPSAMDPRATFNYYRSDYTPPRFCYGDPVYDAWYAEAMSYDLQKDTDKIVELCQKMEEKLLNELAVIPVYELANKVLFSDDVTLPAGGYVPGYGWGIMYASMGGTTDDEDDNTVVVDPDEGATDTEVSATIGKELLDQIAEDVKESTLQFTSNLLDMIFNNDAIDALAQIINGIVDKVVETVEFIAKNVTEDSHTNRVIYDLSVAVNGEKMESTDFGDGEVTVTIPTDSLDVGENQTVKVWYIERDGHGNISKRTEMKNGWNYDRKNHKVVFKTNHFSEYEVGVVNEGVEPTVSVTNPTNGTAINHSIVAGENGWNLTLAAADTTKTYVYLVKYTDANGVVSTKVANTNGKYSDGEFEISADATDVTVESALLGDTNGDAYIDSSDALLVLKYSVGSETPSDVQKLSADVNGDGYCDSSDALLILKYSVGSITGF